MRTPNKAHSKGVNRDRGLIAAKTLMFLICSLLGCVPLISVCLFTGISGVPGFLEYFASMTLGLIVYFSFGCWVLRHTVKNYLPRLRLGERGHAGETALMAGFCNVGVHTATLVSTGFDPASIALIFASAVFFSYPVYYLVTTFWSTQTEVRQVITGALRLNTTHFANVPRKVRSKGEYLPITISLPVHTESNEVIFETIRGCKRALAQYQQSTGQTANLVVSDDGLAKLLGGKLSASALEACLLAQSVVAKREGLRGRSAKDTDMQAIADKALANNSAYFQAAERIHFYRNENISFVARPVKNRKGKFKKGGNLNYTYGIARQLEAGVDLQTLFAPGGLYADGYAEGTIHINELICLLDKDSGLAPDVLTATSPEFAADPWLAFTQHTTHAANENDNYFALLQARFTNMVYRVSLTSKALQGLQVHLMGHSAFLRKSFLESTGGWAEDRVSEDYAKALDAYSTGWHAKHIAFEGLEFTEQVCTNFVEETDKQLRYCYGVSEVVLGARHRLAPAMFADMLLYYLSYFNLAAALPVISMLLVTHQIYYLFAGIVINVALFLILPVIQGWLLGPSAGFTSRIGVVNYFLLNALAFLGHTFSMLRGFVAYFSDRVRSRYQPFGVTNVDKREHTFAVGAALMGSYIKRNALVLIAWSIIAVGCVFILQDVPPHIVRPLVVAFLLAHVLAPAVLTPQLFSFSFLQRNKLKQGVKCLELARDASSPLKLPAGQTAHVLLNITTNLSLSKGECISSSEHLSTSRSNKPDLLGENAHKI